MLISPRAKRILIDGLLWAGVVVSVWFMLTRHFVAFFAVSGRWQMPSISRVYVGHVQRDKDNTFTDVLISVRKDGSQSVTRLLKEELYGVDPGDTLWLIRPPYVTVTMPPAYRFKFFRLVTEFPEFFFFLCASWLFVRFRSRLGKPHDAYEGEAKPTVTYIPPTPDSWGRSKNFIKKDDE